MHLHAELGATDSECARFLHHGMGVQILSLLHMIHEALAFPNSQYLLATENGSQATPQSAYPVRYQPSLET